MNYYLIKTNSANPDFHVLINQLDAHFSVLNGDKDAFYSQYNHVDVIKHVVLAYQNGKPIGCGAIKEFSENIMEIKRMFVLPDYRGHGIALKILNELELWAAELNYLAYVLETGKNQPEAIRLYQKAGYSIIPNYGQYLAVKNSVCMMKTV